MRLGEQRKAAHCIPWYPATALALVGPSPALPHASRPPTSLQSLFPLFPNHLGCHSPSWVIQVGVGRTEKGRVHPTSFIERI